MITMMTTMTMQIKYDDHDYVDNNDDSHNENKW